MDTVLHLDTASGRLSAAGIVVDVGVHIYLHDLNTRRARRHRPSPQ